MTCVNAGDLTEHHDVLVVPMCLLQDKDAGDLTERIELRKRLKCKSFKWFLDNVYPEKFIPDENVVGYGMVSESVL